MCLSSFQHNSIKLYGKLQVKYAKLIIALSIVSISFVFWFILNYTFLIKKGYIIIKNSLANYNKGELLKTYQNKTYILFKSFYFKSLSLYYTNISTLCYKKGVNIHTLISLYIARIYLHIVFNSFLISFALVPFVSFIKFL